MLIIYVTITKPKLEKNKKKILKRPNVPPPPQEEIHVSRSAFPPPLLMEPKIGSAQPNPQQQYLDRPILMMPIPNLPQMGKPSYRPKQRIFRTPQCQPQISNHNHLQLSTNHNILQLST
ncbi:hypothetical protein PIB30_041759 [Stylosanthes scabra]|uniref:Uncharacterized protein n=1 Tax=Stylosanthes scabra TaxID=79078 RepID=A0ABU6SFQ6_9FABA|nr:hypothetical protein [Stylosanthes scabra]